MLYTARVLPTISADVTQVFLDRYLTEQHTLLDAATAHIDSALDLLDLSLRTRVAAVVTAAHSLGTPHIRAT